jgi:hypothetical protein
MEDVDIFYKWQICLFYGHFVYLMAIMFILWPFGLFAVYLVYFSRFGVLHQEKFGNPEKG